MSLPMPSPRSGEPQAVSKSGELTDNEWSFILDCELKPKHRKEPKIISFINCFVRCKNVSQAAAETGVTYGQGYSWRHQVDIASCIQKIIDKSAMKYGFDATEIMERTKEIVDFDPLMLQNPDGTFKNNLHDIAPEARRNLKKLKVKNLYSDQKDINGMKSRIVIGEVIEYEFYDKLKAIELSGKEKEMFKNTTKVEHSVTKDMATILLAAAQRGQQASLGVSVPKTVESYVVEKEESDE
jgi:hypothetical protein